MDYFSVRCSTCFHVTKFKNPTPEEVDKLRGVPFKCLKCQQPYSAHIQKMIASMLEVFKDAHPKSSVCFGGGKALSEEEVHKLRMFIENKRLEKEEQREDQRRKDIEYVMRRRKEAMRKQVEASMIREEMRGVVAATHEAELTNRIAEHLEEQRTQRITEQKTRADLKNRVYMQMAEDISHLGTCRRMQVGCVLLNANGRVAAVGYNGAGPGMPHCSPETCGPDKRCLRCAHAEENAVANLACEPHIAYITHEPCAACTRKMIQAGVRLIYFRKPYKSIPPDEAAARKEWLVHYNVGMVQL